MARRSGLGLALGLGALAGLGLLVMGGSSPRPPPARRRDDVGGCSRSPLEIAMDWQLDRPSASDVSMLLAWVDCDGRTGEDVAALIAHLREQGSGGAADAVRAHWNARRTVDTAEPDGRLVTPEGERASEGEPPADPSPEPPPPTHARGGVRMPTEDEIERRPEDAAAPEDLPNPAARAGYDPRRARDLAGPLSRTLGRGRRTAYQDELRAFQVAAGLEADGVYGPRSYNALRYYGIQRPPRPFVRRPSIDDPSTRYEPRPVRLS